MNIDPSAVAAIESAANHPGGSSGGVSPGSDGAKAVKKMNTAGDSDLNAAVGKLTNFMFDGGADPVPITREKHPVFWHATKNEGT